MSNYDKQYQTEIELFGSPYDEFREFVALNAMKGAKALDVGCGQGRDALMLAHYGYEVTGVDSSEVGIAQMVKEAKSRNLSVNGIVQNFYEYETTARYDAIILDSILHFKKADRKKELMLLDRLFSYLNENGFLFIFVHKSSKKEKELHDWLKNQGAEVSLVLDKYIDYVYEERSINFKSKFQMYMLVLRREFVGNK